MVVLVLVFVGLAGGCGDGSVVVMLFASAAVVVDAGVADVVAA